MAKAAVTAVTLAGPTAPLAGEAFGDPHATPVSSVFFPTLSLGDQGLDVEALQLRLTAQGVPTAPRSVFDVATAEAVASFQAMRGLAATGVADPATWGALVHALGPGDVGPAVAAVERLLAGKVGEDAGVPALFDAATEAAVARFQVHMGHDAHGRLDAGTWETLVWHYQYPDFAQLEWCTFWDLHDEWGTAASLAHLERAAERYHERTGLPLAVGDISEEHGGPLQNHTSHQFGLDADLGLPRSAGMDPCSLACTIDDPCYDREATRALIDDLVAAAHGHIVRIYFEDPGLEGLHGVVRPADGHRDHLHVRYCAALHPDPRYDDCPGTDPGLGDGRA